MRSRKNWNYTLRSRRRLRAAKRFLFLLPSLGGVFCFVILPFGKMAASSFFTVLTNEFAGFRNYEAVFHNEAFRLAVRNTARFIALGLPLLLLGSLGLALMISGSPRLDKYKYLYLLPLAVPAATMVLVWKLLFSGQGFLNRLLGTHENFLGEESAFYILVGSYLWKNLGYTMVLWLAGLRAIPEAILDAAKVDGAGRVKRFLLITLPCLRGCISTVLVVSLLNFFKVFREVYLVGGAYPQRSIYMLQNVFQNWYVNLEQDKLAAGAVLLAAVLGTVSLLLQRLWDHGDLRAAVAASVRLAGGRD